MNSLNLFIADCYDSLHDDENAKSFYEQGLLNAGNDVNPHLKYSKFLISRGDFKSARRKLLRASDIKENDLEILNLLFIVSYKLVKEDYSEYNLKEALSVAKKIMELDATKFQYESEYNDIANSSGFKEEN